MARQKKKKKAIVRLEMRWGGLLSFTVVCFCALLWMFLFGIWTGQSVLQNQRPSGRGPAMGLDNEGPRAQPAPDDQDEPVKLAHDGAEPESASSTAVSAANDSSFYAVQVGAFRDAQRARRAVAQWRARDYKAFYLPPESTGQFNRVFVGHFAALPAAKRLAADLKESRHLKGFITLVPGDRKCYP